MLTLRFLAMVLSRDRALDSPSEAAATGFGMLTLPGVVMVEGLAQHESSSCAVRQIGKMSLIGFSEATLEAFVAGPRGIVKMWTVIQTDDPYAAAEDRKYVEWWAPEMAVHERKRERVGATMEIEADVWLEPHPLLGGLCLDWRERGGVDFAAVSAHIKAMTS